MRYRYNTSKVSPITRYKMSINIIIQCFKTLQ